jgi:hypothetical protein
MSDATDAIDTGGPLNLGKLGACDAYKDAHAAAKERFPLKSIGMDHSIAVLEYQALLRVHGGHLGY